MTQVNLLPSEVRERQKSRRLTAAAVAGVGAIVALLFFVFVLQAARLANANQKLQAQQAVNTDLEGRIGQLQEFQQLKLTLAAREALTAAALDGRVLWSGVLRDISMVIPDQMWLSGMTASLTPAVAVAPAPAPQPTETPGSTETPGTTPAPAPVVIPASTLIGVIQFQGTASDHLTVAKWLTRLEQVTGWANPWISTANKTTSENASDIKVDFTGTVDLTMEASARGGRS